MLFFLAESTLSLPTTPVVLVSSRLPHYICSCFFFPCMISCVRIFFSGEPAFTDGSVVNSFGGAYLSSWTVFSFNLFDFGTVVASASFYDY